jgi:purine-binding chemotaxis protein CheW
MDSNAATTAGSTSGARQVLTFRLGEETFGIDILRVKEIRGWSAVARVPDWPPAVLGVLNLRGAVVPILDLRLRFALPSAGFTPLTVVIVIAMDTADGTKECGLVVDAVSDVVNLEEGLIREVPRFAGGARADCIESLVAMGDRTLILLATDQLALELESPQQSPMSMAALPSSASPTSLAC